MFSRTQVFSLVVLLLGPLAATAVDTKFDTSVSQTRTDKGEGVEVTAVMPGGIGSLMGLKKGDRITRFAFTPDDRDGEVKADVRQGKGGDPKQAGREVQKLEDIREFLHGAKGTYEITVLRADTNGKPGTETIFGTVMDSPFNMDAKGKNLIFVSKAKPQKYRANRPQ